MNLVDPQRQAIAYRPKGISYVMHSVDMLAWFAEVSHCYYYEKQIKTIKTILIHTVV